MILFEKIGKRKYNIVIGKITKQWTEEEEEAIEDSPEDTSNQKTTAKEKKKITKICRDIQIKRNIISLNLIFSPATNKFHKIIEFVEDCSKVLGTKFDNWFESYLKDYVTSNYNSAVIKANIPKIIEFSNKYLDTCNINFDDYVNRDKVSKNSILFDGEEVKKLVQVSNYLKLYFVIAQDTELKLPVRFHREVYNALVKDIANCNILYKLFKIVSSKTYKYNLTDSYMWEYIKTIYCKTTDMHIMTIFNFIVNNILVACDPKSNPIPFITSVIDEAIRWILQSVYKDVIVYSDSINTEDAYSLQGKDNLKTYAYNDSIGRLVLHAYNCLEQENIEDIKFNEAIKPHKETSLFSTYITYPILSKVLNIPYRHLLTIPSEHGYLLNILLYHYLPKEFKEEYKTIVNLLCHYNKDKAIIKTTYTIKNISYFYKSFKAFLGFKNRIFVYNFYSSIVGKLARNTYINLKTSNELTNFPLAKLETDIINFYNNYFDNKLDETFDKLRTQFDKIL